MKKKLDTLISPALVLLIMGVYFFLTGLYPFGDKAIAWCDMKQQVIPILLNFKDILEKGGSIFYNTSNAGGMNFWGVFLFFISSPFSFLVLLVEKIELFRFMNVMVVLKMAVCAFTAHIYFNAHMKKLDSWFKVLLSLMYAFCGYTMMFFQNMVWLDMMYLFPLLLIGLERLISKKKPIMYIIILSMCLIVNFYLSYMVALYLIFGSAIYIYFRYRKEKRKDAVMMFGISTVIVVLLTAFIWLPAFIQYMGSGRGVNLLDSLAQGSIVRHIASRVCFMLCTNAIIAMIPFLFIPKLRKRRTIKNYSIMYILLIIPVILQPVNNMWHTGSYQAFPYRYGYMTVLIGLTLLGYVIEKFSKDSAEKSHIIAIFIEVLTVGLYITVCIYLYKYKMPELSKYTETLWVGQEQCILTIVMGLVAFVAYGTGLFLYKAKFISKRVLSVSFTVLVISEIVMNTAIYIGSPAREDTLYQQIMAVSDKVENDDTYYRVKADKKYVYANMIGALGYNSMAHYTSLLSKDYIFAMKKLGYSSYWMEVNSNGGTKITDAILSQKYAIGTRSDITAREDVIYTSDAFTMTHNQICLPVGIITNNNVLNWQNIDFDDRISIQERMGEDLLNSDNLITRYDATKMENLLYTHIDGMHKFVIEPTNLEELGMPTLTYKIHVDNEQILYFDLFSNLSTELKEEQYHSVKVFVNDSVIAREYPSQLNNGILNLGSFKDEDVTIRIELQKNFETKSFGVFGVNLDNLESAVNNVKGVDVKQDGNKILASCDGKEGEYLYLSIPYDEGFSASINGEKTDIVKINDTFMALKLSNGENNIAMTFYPKGFKTGAIVSIIGVIAFAIYILAIKKFKNYRIKWLNNLVYKLYIVLVAGAFIMIYIFPVCVWFIKNLQGYKK